MNQTAEITVATADVAGATIYYEVRGSGPAVLLLGSPIDAGAFAPLADQLAGDHTVVTMDPRAIHRNSVEDRDQESTPPMRADDVARLLTHLDLGPAAAFGSSGGAVTVLALAQARPGLVHTVIAHEPPLASCWRTARTAGSRPRRSRTPISPAAEPRRLFLADAGIELPEPVFTEMFAAPLDGHAAADEDFFFRHEMRPTIEFVPDLAALQSGATRLVVGIGAESTGQLCDRTSRALAGGLGIEPVVFPGDHTGFTGDPEGFAAALRPLLTAS